MQEKVRTIKTGSAFSVFDEILEVMTGVAPLSLLLRRQPRSKHMQDNPRSLFQAGFVISGDGFVAAAFAEIVHLG
jgi:hypothetical protein